MAFLGRPLAGLYSDDPAVIKGTVTAMWVLMGFALPAMVINAIDPCLRAGGDVKWVMIQTFIGVWVVRLPLTYLMGYVFKMGVAGVYIANTLGLIARAVIGLVRFSRDKWMYKRV